MKKAVMIWGASSGAGKSLVATALCRWAAQRGIDVAPFKAQNMSNNARVVPGADGGFGEIGAAQYFQALAARVSPTVDMNPVLLKPERDTMSQVVVRGRVDAALACQDWRERSKVLADTARESFERLAARHDVIILEGAGSPAEINLAAQDYVNLGAARWARDRAPLSAWLVVDIDRGGAFAHLHGTWTLLPADLRPHLTGFVLNKFRGDPQLLAPGPQQLYELTGVPVAGVLPMRRNHGLPEEDGLDAQRAGDHGPVVAIVAWPHASNIDEFQPLARACRVRWIRTRAEMEGADLVILPGSKQVSGDLAWLRAQHLDAAVVAHAHAGRRVLGVCGGLQVLGTMLDDPEGVDGEPHGPLAGLGLLPIRTRYRAPKHVTTGSMRFDRLTAPWDGLSCATFTGYEIRNGDTTTTQDVADGVLHDAQHRVIGWQYGSVLGIAAHGLLENGVVMRALFGSSAASLDESFDRLAELIEEHLSPRALIEAAL